MQALLHFLLLINVYFTLYMNYYGKNVLKGDAREDVGYRDTLHLKTCW